MVNEKGVYLVEVIASVLLISIILISFFSLFIQSKKTNVHSENISDATYIVQTEMEKIYLVSKTTKIDTVSDTFDFNNGYAFKQTNTRSCNGTSKTDFNYSDKYTYSKSVNNYLVELDVSILCNYPHTTSIKITAFEQRDGQKIPKATMTNAYLWKSN